MIKTLVATIAWYERDMKACNEKATGIAKIRDAIKFYSVCSSVAERGVWGAEVEISKFSRLTTISINSLNRSLV